ncbi:MAG: hypothetical protein DIU78_010600 [Pseudomonadota bacterium]
MRALSSTTLLSITMLPLALLGAPACGGDGSADDGSGGTSSGSGGSSPSGGSSGNGGTSNAPNGGSGGTSGSGGSSPNGGNGGSTASGGTAPSGGTGGTSGGASGAGGSSASGGNGGGPDTPILDRAPRLEYDCSLTRPMTSLEVGQWGGGTLVPADDGALLAWLGGQNFTLSEVRWSSLDMMGELGTPQTIHSGDEPLGQLRISPRGERYTVIWGGDRFADDPGFRLVEVNASGEPLVEPKELSFLGPNATDLQIVATDTGHALVWTSRDTESTNTLNFVLIDEEGNAQGTPRVLAEGSGYLGASTLVRFGDGFLLLYAHIDYVAEIQDLRIFVLDETGEPVREPVREDGNVGSFGGFGTASVIVRGDRALVAWTEGQGGFELSGRSATINLRWYDSEGEPVGELLPLQEPIIDQENVTPHLVDFGDDIGLFWSQGTIIYICAGCYPDNHLNFVVLDGEDLTPKSDVIEIESPIDQGLLNPQAVRADDTVLVTASVTHHVFAEGASATLSCPRLP